jgi:hypothetical protein
MKNGKISLNLKHYLGGKTLNNHGFKILKMVLTGVDKKDAVITFEEGLNVISGASNTGKTFIFQCINFLFGGTDKPKPIKESKGYDELYLEIESYDNKLITIRRNISDKKMFLYRCSFNDINKVAPQKIENQHSKDNPENISTILLNLCNCTYKNVVKNKKMETESFSYRYFAHFTMLSEKKIISEDSPIYDDRGNRTKTKNINAFQTVLTGVDNVICEKTKKDETSKVKVQGKLELINEMIINSKTELTSVQEIIGDVQYSNINDSLATLQEYIKNERVKLNKLEKERSTLWKEIQKQKSEKLYLSELIKRFELLKQNYNSDYERLDFIDESEYYLGQLIDVKCPLCNNEVKSNSEFNSEEIKKAINVEKDKLKLQMDDLSSTIIESNKKVNTIQSLIMEKSKLLDGINIEIEEDIKPKISEMLLRVENLLKVKDKIVKKDYLTDRINDMENSKKSFIALSTQEKVVVSEVNTSNESLYNEFCKIVHEIFIGWKFREDSNITFDEKDMDLIIDDEVKKSFGKGFCAIINSSFVIALMKYAIKLDLPHPKIIILDSPLTTYKGKDGEVDTDTEKVTDVVKQAFYKHLSKLDKGVQIIILDNAEPNEETQNNINYIHFTGNKNIDRTGFIPAE